MLRHSPAPSRSAIHSRSGARDAKWRKRSVSLSGKAPSGSIGRTSTTPSLRDSKCARLEPIGKRRSGALFGSAAVLIEPAAPAMLNLPLAQPRASLVFRRDFGGALAEKRLHARFGLAIVLRN